MNHLKLSAQSLTLARDYAAKMKKPFPKINDKILQEKDWPKDIYVFKGKYKPTVIFMPLFNRRNCKGLLHSVSQHLIEKKSTKIFKCQRCYISNGGKKECFPHLILVLYLRFIQMQTT